MQTKVIGILLSACAVYFFLGNLTEAAAAGFLFACLCVFIELIKDVCSFIRGLAKSTIQFNIKTIQNNLEKLTIYFLLAFIILLAIHTFFPNFKRMKNLRKLEKIYYDMPSKYLKRATNTLKQNPNAMQYCSLLMLPKLDYYSPEIIAAYIVYYRNSTEFCSEWWDWGQSNCQYLKGLAKHNFSFKLAEQVKLCELSRKNKL